MVYVMCGGLEVAWRQTMTPIFKTNIALLPSGVGRAVSQYLLNMKPGQVGLLTINSQDSCPQQREVCLLLC